MRLSVLKRGAYTAATVLVLAVVLSGCIRAAVDVRHPPEKESGAVIYVPGNLSPYWAARLEAQGADRVAADSLLRYLMGVGEPGAYEAWLEMRREAESVIRVRMAYPLYVGRDYKTLFVLGLRGDHVTEILADVVIDGDTTVLNWQWMRPDLGENISTCAEWILPDWDPYAIK